MNYSDFIKVFLVLNVCLILALIFPNSLSAQWGYNSGNTEITTYDRVRVVGGVGSPFDHYNGTKMYVHNADISNNRALGVWQENDGHAAIWAKTAGYGLRLESDSPNRWLMYLTQNGTPRFMVNWNGNVGIGTSAPSATLDVNGSTRLGGLSGSGTRMVVADASGNLSTQTIPTGSTGTGDNLGNHSATTNLDMNNKNIIDANLVSFRAGTGKGIRFWNSNYYKIHMGNTSNYKYGPVQDYSIKTGMNNDPDRGWTWGVYNQAPVVAINTLGDMQIKGKFTAMNKLSVGTTNMPAMTNVNGGAYTTYIKGGLYAEEVKVETGWADYVFEKDYELKSLEEIDTFIEENGHLPNVPSAQEIEENGGVELGTITVNQQEKIEELFLHVIAMNKQMKAMQEMNESIQAENQLLKTQLEQLAK